jgi:NADPH:quinone reductase-like Zn-dependent oxidoreductase
MTLPEDITAEQGASSFVNPMTALGFIETARREHHSALVHTAAASNLGQMLVRICQEDRMALVNVVRNDAQAGVLRSIGAEHVLDSSTERFEAQLASALEVTRATLVFDPIGGGTLVDRILTTMERVASKGAPYSRYGSNTPKQAYIYGGLDLSPTILTRRYGLNWNIGGWLVTPFLQSIGPENVERLRQRVRQHLTTTFVSRYKARVSLRDALLRENVLAYHARRTGEKYLIVP